MLPTVRGVIDRRILVNFRVDPGVVADTLPEPFEPRTVDGYAMGGICLIRFRDLRPRGLPRHFGVGSENAAHRIAVSWTDDGDQRSGVYVPRRDTNSRVNTLLGGRLFPGVHHHASLSTNRSHGTSFRCEATTGRPTSGWRAKPPIRCPRNRCSTPWTPHRRSSRMDRWGTPRTNGRVRRARASHRRVECDAAVRHRRFFELLRGPP